MKRNKNRQKAGNNSQQFQIGNINITTAAKNPSALFNFMSEFESAEEVCNAISFNTNDLNHPKNADLSRLEELNMITIYYSSLMPWKKSHSLSFGSIFNSNYCIDPFIKPDTLRSSGKIAFSSLKKDITGKNCIILGKAGYGKSFLLRKVCVELLLSKKHALYLSAQDWNSKNCIAKYIEYILQKQITPPDDLLLIIDGIDEIFATNHVQLAQLINQANEINCKIWLGCRTDYYETAQCLESIPYKCIYIQEWESEQAYKYVEEHAKKLNADYVLEKYKQLIAKNNAIESFYKNPLRLSMLLYLLESGEDNPDLGNNEYLLYKYFFNQWINNELRRAGDTGLTEETVLLTWQHIARILYVNRYSEPMIDNIAILTSIVNVSTSNNTRCRVKDFLHRSFIEFLLANEAVDSMLCSSEAVIEKLKNNNRSDIDYYIKKAFLCLPYPQKNIIINNLISAYKKAYTILSNESELFYVQNQIVYYLTRMNNSPNDTVKSFIKQIYENELRPIIKQGIAYGAANIGLLDIALDFARKMDKPNSAENSINRAWTLIFYGDQPDEDPLNYEDTHNAPWKRSKDARLKRLSGNTPKDLAFRMFDLCILQGFYESRGWAEMSEDDLKIIENTETEINGYSEEISAFLRRKKGEIISNYCIGKKGS